MKLVYDMGVLGQKVFDCQTEKEANDLLAKNPPGSTVSRIYLHKGFIIQAWENRSFSWDDYNKAVTDKDWKDEYRSRTGKHWNEQAEAKKSSEPRPDSDREKLNGNECMILLGLKPGFSQEELKDAWRQAVKMNHPDKVASLSDEFKVLAEKRTKQINRAYEFLRKG